MQTFAKVLNAKSGQTDVAFDAVARRAEKTSWPSSIVAMVSAGEVFVLGCAFTFVVLQKRLLANSAGIFLKDNKGGELLGGHTGSPSSDTGVVGSKFLRIVFDLCPPSLFVGLAPLRIIGFPSRYAFWGIVVSSAFCLGLLGLSDQFTTTEFFFSVFVIVLFLIGAVLGPFFRSAVTFTHREGSNLDDL